jgi:hypothetical protein
MKNKLPFAFGFNNHSTENRCIKQSLKGFKCFVNITKVIV